MSNYLNISDARADLPDIVKDVDEKGDRVIITVRGEPKAVVLSFDELESLEETAEILAIQGAKEEITKGLKEAKKGRGVSLKDL